MSKPVMLPYPSEVCHRIRNRKNARYPHFEVAELRNAATGRRFFFKRKIRVQDYIDFLRKSGWEGVVVVTRWDVKDHGEILEPRIKIN